MKKTKSYRVQSHTHVKYLTTNIIFDIIYYLLLYLHKNINYINIYEVRRDECALTYIIEN